MEKIKILAIVGSLRKDSYNLQVARLTEDLIGDRFDFKVLDYGDIPFFNEDLEADLPDSIKRVRREIEACQGIWFFSPEYNRSYSGVMKNLLDWLSRPVKGEKLLLKGKPACISGASTGKFGTVTAQEKLVGLLSYMDMKVMNSPRLVLSNINKELGQDGRVDLNKSKKYLDRQIDAFIEFVNQNI